MMGEIISVMKLILRFQFYCIFIIVGLNSNYVLMQGVGDMQGDMESNEPYHFNMYQLNDIANELQRSLFTLHDEYTNMNLLTQRDGRVVAENVNSEERTEVLAKKLEILFSDTKIALMKSVEVLEEASEKFIWRDERMNDFRNVIRLNTTSKSKIQTSGEMDELCGVAVNKSLAGIHIPVEVYEGYMCKRRNLKVTLEKSKVMVFERTGESDCEIIVDGESMDIVEEFKYLDAEIVNGLKWSLGVDKVFQENREKNPNLSWQYFAAHTGFMRFYPSVYTWYVPPPYAPVDLFDARMRPWYIQAASAPKDVVILMDRSGSVHGQTFTIMKFAVETLLDSLGENDYFNIAAFNETTSWVSQIVHEDLLSPEDWECNSFNTTLIPSTNMNKKALKSDIQHLTVKGIANYTDALQFAFNVFQKRGEQFDGSFNCQRMIMLFSDGGTHFPEDTLKKFINDTSTSDIKVFTYAIGPHPIPTAVLKEMACFTGGKFTVITSSSGVRDKIQESYLDIISKPLAATKNHSVHYTAVYTSAVTGNSTISMAVPVFNSSISLMENNDAQLVGVVGIDIPTQQIKNLLREYTLGPLGYAFLVNSNGLVVYHHLIQPHNTYLEGSLDLDMLDLELNYKNLEEIRGRIINGDRGTISFSGQVLLDNFHIINKKILKYTYVPVQGSTYSLVLFTFRPTQHLKVTSYLPQKIINPSSSFISTWNFCGVHPLPARPDLLNKRILEDNSDCNKDMINGLMWAQEWTNDLVESWEKENSDVSLDVISRVIFTRFGLSRSVTGIGAYYRMPTDSLFGTEWRDPINNMALKRGIIERGLNLYPHEQGVFVSKPAYMNNIVTAVVGLNITSTLIDETFLNAIRQRNDLRSSIFLLVDDAAVIISSSQHQNSSGEFLGRRWPLLLEKLMEADIYGRKNITNYQSLCEKEVFHGIYSNAPINFFSFQPLQFMFSMFSYLFNLFECFQCFFLRVLFSTSVSGSVDPYFETKIYTTCSLQHSAYFLTDRNGFSGNISCLGDSAQVLVMRMNSTNAIIIVVEDSLVNLNCDGWKDKDAEEMSAAVERYRIVHPKEIACQNPRERKRPEECELMDSVPCSGNLITGDKRISIIVGIILLGFFL